MAQDVKILTSRRGYEFAPDAIRLTVVSLPDVQRLIQNAFLFQVAGVGSPMPTFGPVPATIPPGMAFDVGAYSSPNGIFPIRFLHFEQRRVVIDVPGPSGTIDPIYQQLRELLKDVRSTDGSPVLGEPQRVLEYSEISLHLNIQPETILPPQLLSLYRNILTPEGNDDLAFVPGISVQLWPRMGEYQGTNLPGRRALELSLRAGSTPEDRHFFSAAPLDSETHLRYLEQLERALTPVSA